MTRQELIELGLKQLPQISNLSEIKGKNGEELATDEAAVWKRVLNYRISKTYQPKTLLETHPGLNISTQFFKYASRQTAFFNYKNFEKGIKYNIIDIDPFGQPWDTIEAYYDEITLSDILMVSNGEAQAVVRNLKKAQRFPTNNYGKKTPKWVVDEYLPSLEEKLGKKVQFFYCFPTTVRVILSNLDMPISLWEQCPNWMWWLNNYKDF